MYLVASSATKATWLRLCVTLLAAKDAAISHAAEPGSGWTPAKRDIKSVGTVRSGRVKIQLIVLHRRVVAVISAKKHKRQRRKRQSVTAKREKSQTPKFITAIQP